MAPCEQPVPPGAGDSQGAFFWQALNFYTKQGELVIQKI